MEGFETADLRAAKRFWTKWRRAMQPDSDREATSGH
jgi:hypothetical protein